MESWTFIPIEQKALTQCGVMVPRGEPERPPPLDGEEVTPSFLSGVVLEGTR